MTIYDLPKEERIRVTNMICKIIGKREDAVNDNMSTSQRIQARANYDKLYEKLANVWMKHGDKALSMAYTWYGSYGKGVTPSGKAWEFDMNSYGWTERTHHCGSLYIEGQGCVFTSGTLARAFERILES